MSRFARSLVLVIVVLYILGGIRVGGGYSVNLSFLQILLLPFIAIICLGLSAGRVKIPRTVIFSALVFGLCAFLIIQHKSIEFPGTVVLSRFENDLYEATTRVFWLDLSKRNDKDWPIVIERIPEVLKTKSDVSAFMEARKNVDAVLWGTPKWLRVSFRQVAPLKLSHDVLSPHFFELEGLSLPVSVGGFGLSDPLNAGSSKFLSLCLRAYVTLKKTPLDDDSWEVALLDLKNAYLLQMRSSSRAYKAFAAWLEGTHYLVRALTKPSLEIGMLHCATQSFSRAAKYLGKRESPGLLGAIRYNHGIAVVGMGIASGNKRLVRAGVKRINRVHRMKSETLSPLATRAKEILRLLNRKKHQERLS